MIKKQLVAFLVIIASFSALAASAEEPVAQFTDAPATLAICDHNGDHVRNLSDVVIFAGIKDTFDVNDDGIHDLSDLGLYATNNQDDDWCALWFGEKVDNNQIAPKAAVSNGGDSNVWPPSVSDVADESLCSATTLTWKTSADSISWLIYGTDKDNLDQEYKSEDTSKTHLVTLEGLETGATYYYVVKATNEYGTTNSTTYELTLPSNCPAPEVLGEKIQEEVCTYGTLDEDVLGQAEWADGTLLRGCGPEVYIIENQAKRHITSLEELVKYIGQRIYNVTSDILNLF